MLGLSIEEATGADGLDRLASDWRRLFAAAPSASPFLAWEWIRCWERWLGDGGSPRVLVARDGGMLAGLLPLREERASPVVGGGRRLSFLGERLVGADYLDVLALPGREREVASAFAEHLAQKGDFELLELRGLAGDSPSLPALTWRFAEDRRFDYRLSCYEICPQLRIDGGGWPQVRSRIRRSHEFGRKLRRLQALDGFEHCVLVTPGCAGEAVERFLVLHQKRWAIQGGSDATRWPRVQAFHREVAREAARAGVIRFEEIWVQGQCRASVYGLDRGERFSFYQCGFDREWAKQSVGFVALGLSIQGAVERGARVYDFLRGAEPYKFDWADSIRTTVKVQVARRSRAAAMALAREQFGEAARLTARAILPAPGIEFLRRRRRAQGAQ